MSLKISPTKRIIKEYLSANHVSQKALAQISGYTEKQVSMVLNGKVPVTKRFAEALSKLNPDTKPSFWLAYDEAYLKQEKEDALRIASEGFDVFAKTFSIPKLIKNSIYEDASKTELMDYFKSVIDGEPFRTFPSRITGPQVHYLQDTSPRYPQNKNLIYLWMKMIEYNLREEGRLMDFLGFETLKEKMRSSLKSALFSTESSIFQENIQFFCESVGINVCFSSAVPSTYIRGAVFSKNKRLFVVLTDRFKSIEFTSFAFVHELYHILNGDVPMTGDTIQIIGEEAQREERASLDAKDFLVGSHFEQLKQDVKENPSNSRKMIIGYANRNQVMPGIVLTFLQHEGIVDYARHRDLLHRFCIDK